MDEPTAGMSPDETWETADLIKKLRNEENITILFTEHDMAVVFEIADRVSVLHQGRLIYEGTPEEVITARNIKEVYGAEGCVYTHPLNNLPAVLLNPGNNKSARSGDTI